MPTMGTIPVLLPTKQTVPADGRIPLPVTTTVIQTAAGRRSFQAAVLHPAIQGATHLLLREAAAAEVHHPEAAVPVLLYQGRAVVNARHCLYPPKGNQNTPA